MVLILVDLDRMHRITKPSVRYYQSPTPASSKSIYIPRKWLQSDESVRIRWAGNKTFWAPSELLPLDSQFEDTLFDYVASCYERDFGCNLERMTMYKALFVDDNADIRWTTTTFLQAAGFVAEAHQSAASALTAL